MSKGGAGAWPWAYKEPDRWAGIAVLSPARYSEAGALERIAQIPTQILQGSEDRAVSISENRRIARGLRRLRSTHRYVELPGFGHDLLAIDVAGEVFLLFLQTTRE